MENSINHLDDPASLTSRQDSRRWLLATNQLNLMFMLAAGLILPPMGFGGKYYRDSLTDFPGWIPLFADTVPRQVVNSAISEAGILKPCAAVVNLAHLRGQVLAVRSGGSADELAFPEGLKGDEAALLIPAPLPTSWVESVVFRSKGEKADCKANAQDYANVPLSDFKHEIKSKLFAQTTSLFIWPPADLALADRDDSLDIVMAAGGMMAMMFLMGNRGEISVAACRLAFDREEDIAAKIDDPMIRGLGAWLTSGSTPNGGENSQPLFWGIVERIARCRSNQETNPRDAVLEFLENRKESMEELYKTRLTGMTDELRDLARGFAGSTVSELFQRHKKLLSRALMLFFLRDTCSELVEFKNELLTETDYLAAALLFGARDGWLGLPSSLRDRPGLSAAVSHRMAGMAHHLSGSGIELGAPPPRCLPLREVFFPGLRGLSSKQRQAAAYLALQAKWNCVHTKISLGRGDYRLVIDGSGTHILLPGEVKAVTVEPDMAEFFRKLAEAPDDRQLDSKVREIIQS